MKGGQGSWKAGSNSPLGLPARVTPAESQSPGLPARVTPVRRKEGAKIGAFLVNSAENPYLCSPNQTFFVFEWTWESRKKRDAITKKT